MQYISDGDALYETDAEWGGYGTYPEYPLIDESPVDNGSPLRNSVAAARPSVPATYPYVIVIVMAQGCPACEKFKSTTLQPLLGSFNKKGYGVEQIMLDSTDSPIPSTYPSALDRFVQFFPCVILMQGKSWSSAMTNRSGPLSGRVFNAKKQGNRFVAVDKSQKQTLTASNVLGWISSIVDQDVSLSMQLS